MIPTTKYNKHLSYERYGHCKDGIMYINCKTDDHDTAKTLSVVFIRHKRNINNKIIATRHVWSKENNSDDLFYDKHFSGSEFIIEL